MGSMVRDKMDWRGRESKDNVTTMELEQENWGLSNDLGGFAVTCLASFCLMHKDYSKTCPFSV